MKDNRKIIQVLTILTIIFTVMGGSLAYWNWTTDTNQATSVVFTTNADFSCSADGGGNITNTTVKLAPTTCTDSGYTGNTPRVIKRKITVKPTITREGLTISMDLWLKINGLGTGLSNSNNFKYVLTTSSTSCEEGTIKAQGTFNGLSDGSKIDLLSDNIYSSSTTEEYWLYIWLDKEEKNDNTMNQTFNFSLGGECTDNPATLKCSLDVTETGIKFDSYSDGVVSTGLSASSTVEYNNVTSLPISEGIKYGYIKDADGNVGSCTVDVRTTVIGTVSKYINCDSYTYEQGEENVCEMEGYGEYVGNNCVYTDYSNMYRLQKRCVYENDTYSWIDGIEDGYVEAWDSECSIYSNTECNASTLGTLIPDCSSDFIYLDVKADGQVECQSEGYVCPSGYAQLNDSYCYKLG